MDFNSHTVTMQVNVTLQPFGQASLVSGHAHPDRFEQAENDGVPITQVMPLRSSGITPGYARPASV